LRPKVNQYSVAELNPSSRSLWVSALLTLLVAVAGFMLIGPAIGMLLALPFFPGTAFQFLKELSSPTQREAIFYPFFIVQGCATLVGLGLVPAWYWYRSQQENIFQRIMWRVPPLSLLVVAAIVIFFMGLNSVFIEWNANLELPEALSGFEQWARALEDAADRLTQFMTAFSSPGQFVVAMLVVAVFAGFAEELVFRGMLQPLFHRASGNIHVAIWLSAVLFSALHMQFFGFVPRVLLGVLFGYLYAWSGNLLVPMVAHFVNNGFSLLMIYLNKTQVLGMDLESTQAAPWPAVVVSTMITILLLRYYQRTFSAAKPQGQ